MSEFANGNKKKIRKTYLIDKELAQKTGHHAIDTERTVSEVVEDALRQYLQK